MRGLQRADGAGVPEVQADDGAGREAQHEGQLRAGEDARKSPIGVHIGLDQLRRDVLQGYTAELLANARFDELGGMVPLTGPESARLTVRSPSSLVFAMVRTGMESVRTPAPGTAPADPGKTYRVKDPGQHIMEIAQQTLGDRGRCARNRTGRGAAASNSRTRSCTLTGFTR